MKRILLYLLCCLTALSLLTGCSTSGPATTSDSAEAPLTAVVTIFPAYDWLRQLLGARADTWEITLLTDSGVDMHSYQPSTSDMAKVISCDLLIYVGGTSDAWLKDAIDRAEAPDCAAIDLMELLGDTAVTEELTDGMTAGDEEGEAPEYDEHVWLSPANARLFCAAIAEALTDLDPDGGETYAANLTAYDGELAALDAACRSVTENAELHTLLFGDRFPFRYFTDEYGLEYYAAFPGCSAETEASFETIAYLAGKLAAEFIQYILPAGKRAAVFVGNKNMKDHQLKVKGFFD